ncbi:hypothetical protein L211DRAFT_714613 [Terfezia boudieri ATCC MYA-4762]|uniref:Uncharacterized protein n=1 Tax=Terfezia boudieri ATCC MYA-4762 TaxID=1051890 RepID=A0A3N4M0B8_9PEZI|nr:hypothetical protein L211DRAFT_714613 [Terfezia boudieri ATCC MYA-4762]
MHIPDLFISAYLSVMLVRNMIHYVIDEKLMNFTRYMYFLSLLFSCHFNIAIPLVLSFTIA